MSEILRNRGKYTSKFKEVKKFNEIWGKFA